MSGASSGSSLTRAQRFLMSTTSASQSQIPSLGNTASLDALAASGAQGPGGAVRAFDRRTAFGGIHRAPREIVLHAHSEKIAQVSDELGKKIKDFQNEQVHNTVVQGQGGGGRGQEEEEEEEDEVYDAVDHDEKE